MDFYKGKKVLVSGGTGLIGRPLVKALLKRGSTVTVASLDPPKDIQPEVKFKQLDLREFQNCIDVCHGQDIVFQLAGVKGSPAMSAKRPASFFVPTLQFSINLMEAARQARVERYMFTSSVGVYSPAEIFHEDDVWSTFPSQNDRFAGWAKRMGELQAQAYEIEHDWQNISIVRPANVYGPYDNFDHNNAMVIPSLIKRIVDGENPLVVWGDGSAIRDFIFSEDVALGMLHIVEHGETRPVNLGSGQGLTIKVVAEAIASCFPENKLRVEWDTSKPNGDACRIMDTSRAESIGFTPKTNIEEGIKQTVEWYLKNKHSASVRYNAFLDKRYLKANK